MEFRIKTGKHKTLVVSMGILLMTSLSLAATEINNIGFKVEGDQSVIEIVGSGPIVYQKTENAEGRQIVFDIEDATLAKSASRKLDTSSFNSVVSLISPYQVSDGGGTARVVVQLKSMSSPEVSQEGNKLVVRISNGGAAMEESASMEVASKTMPEVGTEVDVPGSGPAVSMQKRATKDVETAAVLPPKDNIDLFLQNQKSKNFRGKPVSLQVREADVRDILRLIADASGFNIVLGVGITGKLTLSLVDVPWDQALDVVLQTLKLGAERNNNVLRILTLQNLTAQKQEELAAKQALEASAPKITRLFPISYAKPEELSTILTTFGKSSTGAVTATVQVDKRTNSIVVQDIADNIDRMAKLVELLDTQTPQVMIEAKVVEATESFSKNMNGQFGLGSQTASIGGYAASFNGMNPVDSLVGTTTGVGTIADSGGGGNFGFSPVFSFLPGSAQVNAFISLSELQNDVKVVSSPKTVVLNKEQATITQTTPVLFQTTVATDSGVTTTFEQADAILKLDVTPTVTNDEGVLLELSISRDVPQNLGQGQQAIAKRDMKTKVLVQSGSTLVIGGIYTMDSTSTESGFPWLKDIPILGALFKSETATTARSELFIFVSPKVINAKKAGLAG